MGLYRGDGVAVNIGTAEAREAYLNALVAGVIAPGSQIGATLHFESPGSAWEQNATTAYNSLLEAYKKAPNVGIPFFISTDQHGRGVEQHRWVNNADVDGLNIVNINLGDTVTDVFNVPELNNILSRTRYVKNYIGNPGNHEYIKWHSKTATPRYDISRVFMSTYSPRYMIGSVEDYYCVIDAVHDVKILSLDNYILTGTADGKSDGITSNAAEWLIEQMAKDDYDIIVVAHQPVNLYEQTRGSDAKEGGIKSDIEMAIYNCYKDRRAKRAGTIVDSSGVSHSYDFTACKHELLCTLHGHRHVERYITEDGLTSYTADWYGNNKSCVFGLVDRDANLLRVFKFDASTVYDELDLPI